jgi:hypothetical protein
VLTHLQHIDLLPLLVDLDGFHLSFSDNLHSCLRFSAKMIGELYLAKLAFAQSNIELVEIEQIRVSHAILNH